MAKDSIFTILSANFLKLEEEIRAAETAGADILVMGSAFFHSTDYGSFIKQFREIVRDR